MKDKELESDRFNILYEKIDALRRELSWTHYRTLLKVENIQAREFYIDETIACNWNTRYLERAINTSLYERLLISQDKKPVLDEVKKLETHNKPEDYIKDPYVLDFLGLEENKAFLESDLEESLVSEYEQPYKIHNNCIWSKINILNFSLFVRN
ncbi:MAG: DUF1016 N-terminal domain-containing protein [Cyanobacteriota bacterium]